MQAFLLDFDQGKWWKVYKSQVSPGFLSVLTKLLSSNPSVRGDTTSLLNHPWLKDIPDVSQDQ